MKRGKPTFIVRQGSSIVRGYKYGGGRFCLAWYRFAGDKLQRQTKTGEKEARTRASEIALDLANDRSLVTELTGSDRDAYLRMDAMASELGIPLFDLVEQAAAAKRKLGAASILDAAESHLQVRTINGSRAEVRDLVRDFMRRKRTAMLNGDLSAVHVKNLGEVLEGVTTKGGVFVASAFFAKYGGRKIGSIVADEFQDWLNDRRDRWGKVVGARRRRNIRAAIVALFNDAQRNRHLPQGMLHAAELTDCPKVIKGKEPTFETRQFDLLIDSAHSDADQCELVPALAIGAFGRMRMSEIARLDWTAIELFEKERGGRYHPIAGEIDVSAYVAGKVAMPRIIEITPALAKWLRPYERTSGKVLDPKITRLDNRLRRLAKKLGLKWLRNILRGSSTSYLYAFTEDLNYVAAQHGTSERELKREYLERKTHEQGKAWVMSIVPNRSDAKILELRWTVNE